MPPIDLDTREIGARTRAMATEITVRVVGTSSLLNEADLKVALARSLQTFGNVERACSRFDPTSPLMRANRDPHRWHDVGTVCFDAIAEAWRAYELTEGRFDPRVLSDLAALGYDRSLPFADGEFSVDAPTPRRRLSRPRWSPRFRPPREEVSLGGLPVDLGGIGKGLAVRWASIELRTETSDFVINAGGDCYCAGRAPDHGPWLVGVEDPWGQPDPMVVLALTDQASATSSIRVRHWNVGDTPVHHLIDPRSGLPGGPGLVAVTVVAPDPADAEVWSKTLFLAGAADVAGEASRRSLAACWISTDGGFEMSEAMEGLVVWRDRP